MVIDLNVVIKLDNAQFIEQMDDIIFDSYSEEHVEFQSIPVSRNTKTTYTNIITPDSIYMSKTIKPPQDNTENYS